MFTPRLTPYLHAVAMAEHGLFGPGSGFCEPEDARLTDSERWKKWNAWRTSRGLFLPGDFVVLGGPITLTADDDEPYHALVFNTEHGEDLSRWMSIEVPWMVKSLKDASFRRIADLIRVLLAVRTRVLRDPFAPESGRVESPSEKPICGFRVQPGPEEHWDTWFCYENKDGRKQMPLTGFACLNILAGALSERISNVLAAGVPPGTAPALARVATFGAFPVRWTEEQARDVAAIPGELTALAAAREHRRREVAELSAHLGSVTLPARSATGPDEPEEEPPPFLTTKDLDVLLTMASFPWDLLLSAEMIAAAMPSGARLSDRTVGPIVQRFIDILYADRPDGERSGARLTTAGRRRAAKLASLRPSSD